MKANEVKDGMKVTMAGIPGTIVKVCEWSRAVVNGIECVMVEVRLPGGIGCYSCTDLVAAGFVVRHRFILDWLMADGCFNSNARYAAVFATEEEAGKAMKRVPGDFIVEPVMCNEQKWDEYNRLRCDLPVGHDGEHNYAPRSRY